MTTHEFSIGDIGLKFLTIIHHKAKSKRCNVFEKEENKIPTEGIRIFRVQCPTMGFIKNAKGT